MPSLSDFYISSPGALTLPVNTVTYNDGGATNLDHFLGNVFSLTANGTGTTIGHLSVPSERYSFELHLQWISGTITWPTSWTKGDAAPTATGGYVITGTTVDGGISWKISVLSAGLWTPAYITTSLWLDAADSSTVTITSGAVSQWNDKSGNSRNATQNTTSKRPVLSTINGVAAADFDGLDDEMLLASVTTLNSVNQTWFIVAKRDNVAARTEVSFAIGNTTNNDGLTDIPKWADNNDYSQLGYTNNRPTTATTVDDNAYLKALTGGTVQNNYLNGTLFGSGTTQSTGNFNVTSGYVGSGRGVSNLIRYFDGKVGELIILPIVADTATRQKMEGYLAHKWGLTASLPSGHPYKNTPPIS